MKRRLNILCVIVMLVLSYSVLETTYYFFIGAKAGMDAVAEKGIGTMAHKKILNMKYINVVPHDLSTLGSNFFLDSVYNEKSGSYVPATYSTLIVSVDNHPTTGETIVEKGLIILQMLMYIWAIVLFIRLIVSINKSDIFNWRNVRRLRRLGVALIISFACTLLVAWLDCLSLNEVFSLRGYELTFSDVVNTTTLVLGLCSLLVGEVFAIGLKMKEEQELTI